MCDVNKSTVIFLHIPKAAGSTMHKILEREYLKASIYSFDTTKQKASIEKYKQLTVEEKSGIRLLKGHMPFGLHEYIPHAAKYITMLREPVDRVISHYNYAACTPGHYLQHYITKEGMDLQTYVGSGVSHEMDNGQVRLLSGHDDDLPYGACNEELLEQAKRNLNEYFPVVGLAERFDESVLLMREVLGWKRLPIYVSRKVGMRKQGAEPVSPDVRDYIRKINSLDYKLYKYATELFDERLAEYSDKIALELGRFQRINSAYGIAGRTGIGLRILVKRVVRN